MGRLSCVQYSPRRGASSRAPTEYIVPLFWSATPEGGASGASVKTRAYLRTTYKSSIPVPTLSAPFWPNTGRQPTTGSAPAVCRCAQTVTGRGSAVPSGRTKCSRGTPKNDHSFVNFEARTQADSTTTVVRRLSINGFEPLPKLGALTASTGMYLYTVFRSAFSRLTLGVALQKLSPPRLLVRGNWWSVTFSRPERAGLIKPRPTCPGPCRRYLRSGLDVKYLPVAKELRTIINRNRVNPSHVNHSLYQLLLKEDILKMALVVPFKTVPARRRLTKHTCWHVTLHNLIQGGPEAPQGARRQNTTPRARSSPLMKLGPRRGRTSKSPKRLQRAPYRLPKDRRLKKEKLARTCRLRRQCLDRNYPTPQEPPFRRIPPKGPAGACSGPARVSEQVPLPPHVSLSRDKNVCEALEDLRNERFYFMPCASKSS